MQYRQLGNTNIKVSAICLGTMTYGDQNSEAQAHEQLDYALACGINFIDTAEMYPIVPRPETQGLTETYIGNWLSARKNRKQIILASKVTGPRRQMDYIRGGPLLNRRQIEEALHDSLKRLQTDYLDLYQVHWPSRNTNHFGKLGYIPEDDSDAIPIEETLSVLSELVQSGKVRHIGISNETPWGAMQYLQLAQEKNLRRIVSIQNPYNLLNRTYEIGLAEISHREKFGLLGYSPLGFGVLSGKYAGNAQPKNTRLTLWNRFRRYSGSLALQTTELHLNIAKQHNLSPAQMAIAYCLSRPFMTSVIIGATSMEQLKENIGSINITLPEEVLTKIESIHQQQSNPCP